MRPNIGCFQSCHAAKYILGQCVPFSFKNSNLFHTRTPILPSIRRSVDRGLFSKEQKLSELFLPPHCRGGPASIRCTANITMLTLVADLIDAAMFFLHPSLDRFPEGESLLVALAASFAEHQKWAPKKQNTAAERRRIEFGRVMVAVLVTMFTPPLPLPLSVPAFAMPTAPMPRTIAKIEVRTNRKVICGSSGTNVDSHPPNHIG